MKQVERDKQCYRLVTVMRAVDLTAAFGGRVTEEIEDKSAHSLMRRSCFRSLRSP